MAIFCLMLCSCSSSAERIVEIDLDSEPSAKADMKEPERVEVQHILIAFKGSLPGKEIERSFDDAKQLTAELQDKAREGKEDFSELVRAHSDDQFPGIYKLANTGVEAELGEFRRADMTKGFGDKSFVIKKGEVIVVSFDKNTSPYGFHIIKRLN